MLPRLFKNARKAPPAEQALSSRTAPTVAQRAQATAISFADVRRAAWMTRMGRPGTAAAGSAATAETTVPVATVARTGAASPEEPAPAAQAHADIVTSPPASEASVTASKPPADGSARDREVPRFRNRGGTPNHLEDVARDDPLFRKRLALQRASNTWGPLLAEWYALPLAIRGPWAMPDLRRAIQNEASRLAAASTPGGASDERLRLAFEGMLVQGLIGEMRAAMSEGRPLRADVVAAMARDLTAMVDEPPAATLREPKGDSVHVRGTSSLAITLTDVGARILPNLARHAGVATREELGAMLALLHGRAQALAREVLGGQASERDRQSLTQTFLRREAEILKAALESLPAAGAGGLARGRTSLEEAVATYRNWSEDLHRALVTEIADRIEAETEREPMPPSPAP